MGTILADSWNFSGSTTAADPTAGNLRLNNVNPALATALYIDDESLGNLDRSSALTDLAIGDVIRLTDVNNGDSWRQFVATAPAIDHTGWFEVPVINTIASTPALVLSDGLDVTVTMVRPDAPVTGVPGSGYQPPTLSELYAKIGRDLRDADHTTFGTDVLADFIGDGIAEINQIKPNELRLEVTDLDVLGALPFTHVWKVEVVKADGYGQEVIPPNNDGTTHYQNGWTYFATNLQLPQSVLRVLDQAFIDVTMVLLIYGYYDRNPLVDDSDVFDGVLEDEQLLRRYVKALGFQALLADRNLFQQWQVQTNNTDVSPTQLTNMAQSAEAEWNRVKRRAYKVRLPAAGY